MIGKMNLPPSKEVMVDVAVLLADGTIVRTQDWKRGGLRTSVGIDGEVTRGDVVKGKVPADILDKQKHLTPHKPNHTG